MDPTTASITALRLAATPTPAPLGPPYKDLQGRYRTQSLFVETNTTTEYKPLWTLKPVNLPGTLSLYKIYMDLADPTEYRVALATVGSWEHWDLLSRTKWFGDILSKWRAELNVRLKSEHYQDMKEMARSGKTAGERQSAIKWLSDNPEGGRVTAKPKSRGAGRPSKEEVEGALKNELREIEDLAGDAERIGL